MEASGDEAEHTREGAPSSHWGSAGDAISCTQALLDRLSSRKMST